MKEKKKWVKFRHKVYRVILYNTLGLYSRLKYNVKIDMFKGEEKRPYLVTASYGDIRRSCARHYSRGNTGEQRG